VLAPQPRGRVHAEDTAVGAVAAETGPVAGVQVFHCEKKCAFVI